MSEESSASSGGLLLCLNPNPSIDRTLMLDELVVGGVNRATTSMEYAGGKGAIVARTAANLGHNAVCCGPVGGRSGEAVRSLAKDEGLASAWLPIAGQTRINTSIVSTNGSPVDTVVNEFGPELSPAEWEAYRSLAAEYVENGSVVCVSGSFPQGVTPQQARALIEGLNDLGCKVFVDSHGEALEAMAGATPWCLKVNQFEAGAFVGATIDSEEAAVNAAAELAKHVSGAAIITLGGDGAVCATPDGQITKVNPVQVEVVSTVGSGDAFLAGLASKTLEGASLDDALRCAAATGAVNAAAEGQGVVDLDEVLVMMEKVELVVLQNGTSC